jgi:hypothetical protein
LFCQEIKKRKSKYAYFLGKKEKINVMLYFYDLSYR